MIQLKARISSAIEVMNGVYYLQMEAPDIAKEAKSGQFVMVQCDLYVLPRRSASTA